MSTARRMPAVVCAKPIDDTELRAKAEALAAEYDTPLPKGDAGLIEAQRRLPKLRRRAKALHREFKITVENEKEIVRVVRVEIELEEFIEDTPPDTRAGAIVKLRYLTKDKGGRALLTETAEKPLKQILALLEREAQP